MYVKLAACLIIAYATYDLLLPLVSYVCAPLALIALIWQLVNQVLKRYVYKMYFRVDPTGKAVLITGCDSGFGHWTAIKLNALKFHVFACCLNDSCEQLTKKVAHPDKLTVVKMDVTQQAELTAAKQIVVDELRRRGLVLHAVVNNAGD